MLIAGLLQMVFVVKYIHLRKYVVHRHSISIKMRQLDCKLLRRLSVAHFCRMINWLNMINWRGRDDFIAGFFLLENVAACGSVFSKTTGDLILC